MTIVISDSTIMFLVFATGIAIGVVFCWILMNCKAKFEADKLSEYNYELLKLKLDYAVAKREMEKTNKPPKPLYNPHK